MTALYAILAIICIGGILVGAYIIGFDDGVKAEQMRRNLYIITLDEEKRHTITPRRHGAAGGGGEEQREGKGQ